MTKLNTTQTGPTTGDVLPAPVGRWVQVQGPTAISGGTWAVVDDGRRLATAELWLDDLTWHVCDGYDSVQLPAADWVSFAQLVKEQTPAQ